MKCGTLPNLFAGKMHSVLFRKWGENVEGRDWYDMEWYIRKGVSLNLNHFLIRAKDSGDWKNDTITEAEFRELLVKKIDTVKMDYLINDINRFIQDANKLAIWSPKYFHDLVINMKVVS